MIKSIVTQGKHIYNYHEYIFSLCLKACCFCCCKKAKWAQKSVDRLERHEAAREKMVAEVDIMQLINAQRLTKFMAKLFLRQHLRAMIP